jgi:hypothetical protein
MNVETAGRAFAGCIAATAWIGLIVQCVITYSVSVTPPVILTLWILFSYFTIPTNLLVAVVFTSVAINGSALRSEGMVAGTMLYMVLVGVVNALLLWERWNFRAVPPWWTSFYTLRHQHSFLFSGYFLCVRADSPGAIRGCGLFIRWCTWCLQLCAGLRPANMLTHF